MTWVSGSVTSGSGICVALFGVLDVLLSITTVLVRSFCLIVTPPTWILGCCVIFVVFELNFLGFGSISCSGRSQIYISSVWHLARYVRHSAPPKPTSTPQ